jgi:hypothetical protein
LIGQILATETPPLVDLIVAGQRLLGFDSSKSSSTANVHWTWFIDIAVDGQSYSWAFYIDITFDGQRPLDFHLVDSSSPASVCWALIRRSHPRRPTCTGLGSLTSPSMASLTHGLSTSTSPSMASVRWTFISSTHRRRPASAGL